MTLMLGSQLAPIMDRVGRMMIDYSAHVSQLIRNKDFDDRLVSNESFDEESKEAPSATAAEDAGFINRVRGTEERLDGLT